MAKTGENKMARTVATFPSEEREITPTTSGLRDALFDQMNKLRNGDITPISANAFSKLAEQVVRTVELEMKVVRMAYELKKNTEQLEEILPANFPLGKRE